jgi:hypothetical protein
MTDRSVYAINSGPLRHWAGLHVSAPFKRNNDHRRHGRHLLRHHSLTRTACNLNKNVDFLRHPSACR